MSPVDDPLPPVEDAATPLGFERVATVPAPGAEPAAIQQLAEVPGSGGALAAVDTRGLVWLLGPDGAVREEPLLDLRGTDTGFEVFGPESGLRSVAFHPDFATEGAQGFGRLYVAYSASADGAPQGGRLFETGGPEAQFHDVYAEITVVDPAEPTADPATERELFRVEQPFGNHNAGQLAFDPGAEPDDPDHGLLFVGVADGGGANDPLDAAGDLSRIYGKVLRIDPLGGGEGLAYGVPVDNPLVAEPADLGEVWAYGLRNPQQLSFDGGRLYASDIGQGTIEEINVVAPGADHGWDDREGTLANDDGAIGPLPEDDPEGLQYPLAQYDHQEITAGNAAVGGGFVYRGEAIPELRGSYVFTNFPTGEIFAVALDDLPAALEDGRIDPGETRAPVRLGVVDADGEPTSFAAVAGDEDGRVDLRLGLDARGELLAFSKQDGGVYRLTAAPQEGGGAITGTAGDDVLTGTPGDDVIETGKGRDRIELGAAGSIGSDTVTDFDVDGGGESSFDVLVLVVAGEALELSTGEDLAALAQTLAQDGEDDTAAAVEDGDLVLAFGGGDAVRLAGVVGGEDLPAGDLPMA